MKIVKTFVIMLSFCFMPLVSCNDDYDFIPRTYAPGEQPTQNLPSYPTMRQNDYPIVLVHGMMGWGRDEMDGFHYWGGTGDIQEFLRSKGYKTYTASMGPISSNWDRACELYYNIVGGVVDYGAVHSMRHGHNRYGRSYPGFYRQWSAVNKVHFIGHSMGGPTPRVLIQLLENGDDEEKAYVPGPNEAPTSDLFKGNKKGWVASLTTVSGVHNGALAADFSNYREWMNKLLLGFGALAGVVLENDAIYSFDLEQWGLQRQPGETPEQYLNRVFDSSPTNVGSASHFWESQDNCVYDLSVRASQLQNYYAKSSHDVYYASYTANDMIEQADGTTIPSSNMNPLLHDFSEPVGKTTKDLPFGFKPWRFYDGCVSVPSGEYPIGHDYIYTDVTNRKLAPRGVWDVHPVLQGQDHLSEIIPDQKQSTIESIYDFYLQIAKDLASLPK